MPQFIHLTDERLLKRLEKSGIRTSLWGNKVRCVYATPVLQEFQVAHQWLRELKRNGMRTIGAVQFKIPDTEEVLVGRYNEEPLTVTAALDGFGQCAIPSILLVMGAQVRCNSSKHWVHTIKRAQHPM